MGRPSKGQSARVITGSTKITRVEAAALESAYGTVHRGLRAALDQLFVGGSVITDVGGGRQDVPQCRIHLSWEEKARWFDQGVELVRKACTVCGHESVDRAK